MSHFSCRCRCGRGKRARCVGREAGGRPRRGELRCLQLCTAWHLGFLRAVHGSSVLSKMGRGGACLTPAPRSLPSPLQASQLGVYRAFVDNYGVAMEMAEKCCQANAQFAEISEVGRGSSDRAPPALRAAPPWALVPMTQENKARQTKAGRTPRPFPGASGWASSALPVQGPFVSRQGADEVPTLLLPLPSGGQGPMLGLSQVPA